MAAKNENDEGSALSRLSSSKGGVAVLIVLALAAVAFLLPRETSRTVSQRTGAIHVTWKILGITCYDADKQTDISKWVAAQGVPLANDGWIAYGGTIKPFLGATVGKAPKPAATDTVQVLAAISKSPEGKALLTEYYGLLDAAGSSEATALMKESDGKSPAQYKMKDAMKKDMADYSKLSAFKDKLLGTGG